MSRNSILRSINVLNVILLGALGLMACLVVSPLPGLSTKKAAPAVRNTGLPYAGAPAGVAAQKAEPKAADYAVVAQNNLFNPQRRIPVEVAGAGSEDAKPVPKPEFVLYGTLIADEGSLAYIQDRKSPRTTPGRGERTTVLRKGDAISGYTVKSIEPDKVVLASGEDTISVPVIDPKSKREGASARPAQKTYGNRTPSPSEGGR